MPVDTPVPPTRFSFGKKVRDRGCLWQAFDSTLVQDSVLIPTDTSENADTYSLASSSVHRG